MKPTQQLEFPETSPIQIVETNDAGLLEIDRRAKRGELGILAFEPRKLGGWRVEVWPLRTFDASRFKQNAAQVKCEQMPSIAGLDQKNERGGKESFF